MGLPPWLWTVLVVVTLGPLAFALVEPDRAGRWGIVVAGALAAATGVTARVRSGLTLLADVASNLRSGADEGTMTQLALVRQSEADEQAMQAQLDQVVAHIARLNGQLAELEPGQRLYRFVSDRAGDGTYRSHLGLISTVRRDLEELARLMKQWRAEGGESPDPIDRIVLYIDDLDRCSPNQVIQVLQAVHLLLGLDLFVVVVGVDPRWLLRSVRSEYRSILAGDDQSEVDEDGLRSTPQDYLEKIFNIPFQVPEMNPGAFRTLLERTDSKTAERMSKPAPSDVPEPRSPVASGPEEDRRVQRSEAPEPPSLIDPGSEVAAALAREPVEELVPLRHDELDLLASLAPLVATPRAAKRLLNLYRMVRSTRDLNPSASFLGPEGFPADYQAVIVLLGIASSHSRLLQSVLAAPVQPDVLGGLLHRSPTTRWPEFVSSLNPRFDDGRWRNDVVGVIPEADDVIWRRLAEDLAEATLRVTLPDLRSFQLWAPLIARFSFVPRA